MKRILAALALVIVAAFLSGCYYDPGYSYVRSAGYGGDAYYGQGHTVYDGGYYAPGYYDGYYGSGYYGCCYAPGLSVGISSGWYGGGWRDRDDWRGRYHDRDHDRSYAGHWQGHRDSAPRRQSHQSQYSQSARSPSPRSQSSGNRRGSDGNQRRHDNRHDRRQ
jgi:hypothetical protein